MKQKIAKLLYVVFFLSFLLTELFGFVDFAYAQTAGCNAPASGIFWADLSNNPVSSIALNGTYKLVATWNNCQNNTGSIIENGPQFGGRTVGIGVLSATNANDQHADTVTITQCGSYYFQPAINNFGQASPLGTSNTLTIPCTSGGNNNSCPTGQISQGGSCVVPSDFSCSNASATGPSGMKCVVGDGQFEQPCTSTSQCVFDGESCNPQGYCTTGGVASNTGSSSAQCATGQISQNGSCVVPSDFSCSAGSANVPVGMTCVTGDGQFEQPCTSTSQCVFDGESCNPQGYCTTGGVPSNTSAGTGGTTAGAGGTPPTTGATVPLFNPLPEQDLTHVFLLITQGFLAIMGIFAVAFIVVGGAQMVISSGNEEALTKAKKTIVWAVLGLVVALMSFSIIAIVEDLLQANIPAASTSSNTTGNPPAANTNGNPPSSTTGNPPN